MLGDFFSFFATRDFFFRYYYCLFGLGCLFVYLFSFIVCLSYFDSFFFAYLFVLFLFFIICFSVGFIIFFVDFFYVFSFFSFHPLFSVVIIFYSAIKLKTRGVAGSSSYFTALRKRRDLPLLWSSV